MPVCFNVTSERSYQVAEQKPALIIVYDYYDPGRRVSIFIFSAYALMSAIGAC